MDRDFMVNSPGAGYYNECAQAYRVGCAAGMAQHLTDSHCHVYADAIAPRAIRAIDGFYEGLPVTPQDGTLGTLLAHGRKNGVSRFVVHSVATRPDQVSAINAYFGKLKEGAKAAGNGKELITLGTMHPEAENTDKDFQELLSFGLQGVKIHPDIQQFRADDPKAMRIYEMCEAEGLPVLVHTGDFRFDLSNPNRIAPILKRFPDLKLIGAHLGGWSVWEEALRLPADFPNYMVDTSSSFYWLSPSQAVSAIRAYGAERVMFGTDYPMWPIEPELEYFRRLELDKEELEDICWRSCERVYTRAE